jgi:transcriptional regulator with XRE-family HTH domain
MGRKSRPIPTHLGGKLKIIRERLGLSQSQMMALVKPAETKEHRSIISEYEKGRAAPDLATLLAYARAGKVLLDVLVDDSLELDSRLDEITSKCGIVSPLADEQDSETENSNAASNDETPPEKLSLKRFNQLNDESFFSDFLTEEDGANPSGKSEVLDYFKVLFDTEFLLQLDDLYLHLLRCSPLDLREKMTRQYFRRALILASVSEYIREPKKSHLNAFWRSLIKYLRNDDKNQKGAEAAS